MDLTVLPDGIAHQGVGQCTDPALHRTDQGARTGFARGRRIAAGDVPGRQVFAVLVQVQRFFVDRHITVRPADREATVQHIDGDGGGALVAVGIADGVDEGVGRTGPCHAVGVGVVSRPAIGVDHQVAVVTHDLAADLAVGRSRGIVPRAHADHDVAVGDLVRAQVVVIEHVAGDDTALMHRRRIRIGLGHVVDDVDDDLAGDGVAQLILRLIGEGFGQGVRAIVGATRRFRRRGQGVGVSAVAVQMDLTVLPDGIAHQGVGQCTDPALHRTDQGARTGFARGRRIAAGDVPGRQVFAVLVQVQRFFVDRHITVRPADREATVQHIDGDGGGALVAVGIADGVDEGVGRTGPCHAVGVGVVGRAAVGIEDQVAIGAHDLVADITMDGVRGIAAGPHADDGLAIGCAIGPDHIVVEHVASDHPAFVHDRF